MIGSPVRVAPGTRLLAAAGFERPLRDWLVRHGTLMAAAAASPRVGWLEGRGRVAVVRLDAVATAAREPEDWVVRHYQRGGLVARFLGDRYLRAGEPRPFRELRLLERVRALGVPAPPPVGAAVYRSGPFCRGDLVTRLVPDSIDLAGRLFGGYAGAGPSGAASPGKPGGPGGPWGPGEPGAGEAAMRVAGRLVRLLHERGVAHPDLNLKNVLLAAEPGAAEPGAGGVRPAAWPADEPFPLVLDLDRASVGDPLPAARRRAMLERFWRSARKWERRTGRHLEPGLAEAFRAGYDEGWPGPAD